MTTFALQSSDRTLVELYDVALLDLDGVVYVGSDAVPDVPQHIAEAAAAGMRFGFVTNNAARTPLQVAEHLRRLSVPAEHEQVITSAQAAARVLGERLPPDSRVLITGTSALAAEVEAVGLQAVWSARDKPVAVVQGHNPDLSWGMLAEACVAVRSGSLWVATNADVTLPSSRGPLPGNGSFVQIVAQTTGATPLVAGKPEPAMHKECLLRTGAQRPIVVGDRLDTDIEGAHRAGVPSLLVMSGLTRAADLLNAEQGRRPTYLAADFGGILDVHPAVETAERSAVCGAWRATEQEDGLRLAGLRSPVEGSAGRSSLTSADCDALRALAVLAWQTGKTHSIGADPSALDVLTRLGLASD